MKPLSFCLTICFVVLSSQTQAKIWRVNNMPGVTADATTAQAAHDLASAGDTIHLEASTNNYGNISCTKQLTWIGLGEFLSYNLGLQASGTAALLNTVYLYAGSAGTKLTGLSIASSVNIYVTDVVIQRNYIASSISVTSNISNLVITQNFIYFGIDLSNCADAVVMDNILGYGVGNSAGGSAILKNNVMGCYSASGSTLHNCVFQNNILRGNPISFNNSQVSYNFTSAASGLPANNNNQFNVDMSTVFENDGVFYQGRVDKDYRLKAGSPAIGAGAAGADLGAFGGTSPYVLALQPAIPAITALSSPAINNASTITVTFSAKSNQ